MSEKKLQNFLNRILLTALLSFCYGYVMAEKSDSEPLKNTNIVSPENNVTRNLNYSEIIQKIKIEEGELENIPSTNTFVSTGNNFFSSKGIPISSFIPISDEAYANAQTAKDESEKKYLLRKSLFFLDEYLKVYPNDENTLLKAGNVCYKLNRRDSAKGYLMKAYALYPQNPRVHKAMGDFFYNFSDYNMALEYYKLALSSGFLEDYQTNLDTAKCYSKLGDIKTAITYYEVALYLNPNSEEASKNLEKLSVKQTLPDNGETSKTSDDEDINGLIEQTFELKN